MNDRPSCTSGVTIVVSRLSLKTTNRPVPLRSRIAIVTQLGRHLVHPLVVLLVLTVPLTTFYGAPTLFDYGWANAVILGLLATGIAVEHAVAASAVGQSGRRPAPAQLAVGRRKQRGSRVLHELRDRAREQAELRSRRL